MDTLTTFLWNEWVALVPNSAQDAAREIVGLLVGMGWHGASDENALLCSRRMEVFQRLRKIWPFVADLWSMELGSVLVLPSERDRRKPLLRMTLPLLSHGRDVLDSYVAGGRMHWPWIRGLWGAAGALYVPKNGYFLVLRLPPQAPLLQETMNFLEDEGCPASRRYHEGRQELLLRHQQTIALFLSRMGLDGTSLRLDERSILRSMRDQANRLVNCDSANIKKSLLAAERQIAECHQVLASDLMETLPEDLQELVRMRLQHRSVSLLELGQLLRRPVSKSTVEYRWSKLRRLAGDLLKEGRDVHVSRKI